MRLVFIGPPGAGKGTQSAKLIEHLGVPHLSTGDMLREAKVNGSSVGQEAAAYMDSGRLVPDELVLQVVVGRLQQPDCQRGCLFDGFPRTLLQAETLDKYLEARDMPLHAVLELRVPESELIKRLLSRGRSDDDLETIQQRFREYTTQIESLLDYYNRRGLLRTIDGSGATEDIFSRIKSQLASN